MSSTDTTRGCPPSGRYDVVIVGAGHGGAGAAIALRQAKYEGSIALLGAEPEPPYERPPLSKEYLSGEKRFERLLIRPDTFWDSRGIRLFARCRVVSVDAGSRRVRTSSGAEVEYGSLIWATGGVPRRLSCSGHDLAGVHTVRTRSDTDRIRAALGTVSRVVIIGGGYIGLEVTAVLVKAGKQVTVLEAEDRVLARVTGEPLSRFYEQQHRAHGVTVRLEALVEGIEGRNGRVSGVRLAGGELLACDMVIVGIGIVPEVEPLLAAGAQGSGGVQVDRQCRTSLPGTFAVGDCATHPNRFADGAFVRLESVQNAVEQAAIVAQVLSGALVGYDAVPWFWSNQYDLRLQTVGLSLGHDDLVVRGDPATRQFSVAYLRNGRVIALDCVNSTKDFVQGKRLVRHAARVDPAALRDARRPLKEM